MKASILSKLEHLDQRMQEINALLSDAEVISDRQQFQALSKEHAELAPVVAVFGEYRASVEEIHNVEEMLGEDDEELKALAEDELDVARGRRGEYEARLKTLLLPKDPNDESNIFLEIRAGTGGDEAAIFAGDLLRMYLRYAETKHWRTEIMSESLGEHGGYKEVVTRIVGRGAYSRLKFESGGHRVQRVPETESQGRVHTSACTVAVLAELEDIEAIKINPADLKVDTYRASGAGGQHVNKTDSAIRITHLPSGTVVECQDERSQHKNRARAMSLLGSRLLAVEQETQARERAQERKLLVGSGDRSQRIRTYNFPQGRVTDHRVNLTLYKLEIVIQGELDLIVDPIVAEHQAEQLAKLSE